MRRVVIEDARVMDQEVLFKPGGRPRDMLTGSDGYLYLAIEDAPGRIVRLVPE